MGAGIASIYVGSTCGTLARRLWHHNHTHKDPSQRQMTAAQLYQQCSSVSIELIEPYACKTKEELAERERYWIEKLKAEGVPVVNQNIPRAGLTPEQILERRREQDTIRRNSNLYHCPCGKIIQSVNKEEHLITRLHKNRLSSQPPVMNVNASAFSSQIPSSSSTNPDTQPDHQQHPLPPQDSMSL